ADLRLAYVALTRARHRCTVVWGALPDAGTSALGWLLHPPANAGDDPVIAAREAFRAVDDDAIAARLERLARDTGEALETRVMSAAAIREAAMREPAPPKPLHARAVTRRLARTWHVSSFSGLVSRADSDAPDYDPLGAVPATSTEEIRDGAFGLPRGVRFGTLVHHVLEGLDFAGADPDRIGAAVDRELPGSGVAVTWRADIVRLIADTLATPLDPSGFALASLPQGARLDELEFTYPVASSAAADLARILAPMRTLGSRLPEAIGSLVLAPSRGFVRGYVDLVFEHGGRYFLADYKSNWLGNALADYAPQALGVAMAEHFYDLQYLLYTVALHRFLRSRLAGYDYDTHFGGAYYLFMRGMRPDRGPDFGVYFARPEQKLVAALDAALAPTSASIALEEAR
nr:hypothetical protein [Burkholderiales bacterium]